MNRNRFSLVWIVLSLLVSFILNGCSIPQKHASHSPERAFIYYWPAPKDSRVTRLAVKDNIDMRGVVTTAGSQYIAKNYPPAARDAELLRTARERKIRIVGKTNLTEFAIGGSGLNEYFGNPINLLDPDRRRIPGGSSSGSAVAVASGAADVAFGSDTAGSVRVPAACCGLLGLKTTFGLVSLKGVFPLSPQNLDTIGPIAKDVPHLVEGMDLLHPGFAGQYHRATAGQPSGRSIKVARLYLDGTDPKIDRAVDDAIKRAGFEMVVLNPAFKELWKTAKSHGDTVAVVDAWRCDRQFLDKSGVSNTTKAVIQLGAVESQTNYDTALRERVAWQRALKRVLQRVDFIVLPTLQNLPPKTPIFGRSAVFEARVLAMQNTVPVNYAGNPALAVPIPFDSRELPVTSLQLIGSPRSEAKLVNAGRIIMEKTERR